jgi:hypothetical protein
VWLQNEAAIIRVFFISNASRCSNASTDPPASPTSRRKQNGKPARQNRGRLRAQNIRFRKSNSGARASIELVQIHNGQFFPANVADPRQLFRRIGRHLFDSAGSEPGKIASISGAKQDRRK